MWLGRAVEWAGLTLLLAGLARGDGKVFAETSVATRAPVQAPEQRALLHFNNGLEHLVVETAFVGPGTNFAWVIPLPSVPKVRAVSTEFFPALASQLEPELVHEVGRYFVLFLVGGVWVFLVRRAMADETLWRKDFWWCAGIGLITGLAMWSVPWGLSVLLFTMLVRAMRTKEAVAMVTLAFLFCAVGAGAIGRGSAKLLNTLGERDEVKELRPAVTVHAQERVGVYDMAVLSSQEPWALRHWLEQNGYALPADAAAATAEHVRQGWVFAVAKVSRGVDTSDSSVLHPLGFSFGSEKPVYPLRLTGVGNKECRVELYVFGTGRASAKHFKVESCWQTQFAGATSLLDVATRVLRIGSDEVVGWSGRSPVVTKLVGRLDAGDMKADAWVEFAKFRFQRGRLYSRQGAALTALNLGVGLAVLGWLSVLLMEGGWEVTPRAQRRWTMRLALVSLAVAVVVYLALPKTPIIMTATVVGEQPVLED
jgi:hypothetical protein